MLRKPVFWYHVPASMNISFINKCVDKAVKIGYDVISCQDHLIVTGEARGCVPESLTFLTAVSIKYDVKVCPLTLCSLFRNPALVAKTIATMDQLSNGRAMLAIGACWWKEEFEAYGYKFDDNKTRVDKTLEVIKIIKKLWTEEKVNYNGKFWKIENCILTPKPVQKPYPFLWNGGNGPRMMRIAAKHCDGWINAIRDVNKYREKINYIKRYLKRTSNKFKFGNVIYIHKGKDDPSEIIELVDKFLKIGVDNIIFYMIPHKDNLELLERFSKVIEYWKKKQCYDI